MPWSKWGYLPGFGDLFILDEAISVNVVEKGVRLHINLRWVWVSGCAVGRVERGVGIGRVPLVSTLAFRRSPRRDDGPTFSTPAFEASWPSILTLCARAGVIQVHAGPGMTAVVVVSAPVSTPVMLCAMCWQSKIFPAVLYPIIIA